MTDLAPAHDYSIGEPRHHHALYLEDGNIVLQVEKAIFKVHRSVIAKYSSVIKGMLEGPNMEGSEDGTDEKPLILVGDNVKGWELLLELQYDRPRINSERFRGEHLLLILPVAHKYCMENTEEDIITELKKASDSEGFVDLIVASRMVDSDRLYQDGIQRLISSEIPPTLEQAKRMGAEANHTVMSQIMENKIRYLTTTHQTALNQLTTSHRAALRATESRKCRFCAQISTKWSCFSCGKSNLS